MSDDAPVTPPAESPSVPVVAAELAAAETAPPPQTERIGGPLLCVQCRYDLAGLSREQRCPECGTPAAETLASIAAAPVAEHLKLRRGLLLIAIAMIGGIVWLLTGQFSVIFLALGTINSNWIMMVLGFVVPGLSAALVIVSAMGWSRIAAAVGAMSPARVRGAKVVRLLAWLYALLFVCSAIGVAVVSIANSGSGDAYGWMAGIVGFTMLVWVVRTALGFGLLADVATSCRARRVRGTLRVLVWGAITLPIVIVGCAIGATYFNLQTVAGLWIEYFIFGGSLGLAGTIIALGVCALILRRMLTPFARGVSR